MSRFLKVDFLNACQLGDVLLLQNILKDSDLINTFNTVDDMQDILEAAVVNDNVEIIWTLLGFNGFTFDIKDPAFLGELLSSAAESGAIGVATLLLKNYNVDPSHDKNFAIRQAAQSGYLEIVELLLEDNRVNPNDQDFAAICFATKNNHRKIVDLLMADSRTVAGTSIIVDAVNAAIEGNIDMLKANGDQIDGQFFNIKKFLLEVAVSNGHVDVVKFLIADPRLNLHAMLPLAIQKGSMEVVQLLLADQRVNPSEASDQAIRVAAAYGRLEIVALLLKDNRVNPNVSTQLVRPPICEAAEKGYVAIVELLLTDTRVDPSIQDNAAIVAAARKGYPKVVQLLLNDERVDPSVPDNAALIAAAQAGHPKVVELLLKDRRVDLHARDDEAIKLAASRGNWKTTKVLLQDSRCHAITDAVFSQILPWAAEKGEYAILLLLLNKQQIDSKKYETNMGDKMHTLWSAPPQDPIEEAIKKANQKGHHDIVALLKNYRKVAVEENQVKGLSLE